MAQGQVSKTKQIAQLKKRILELKKYLNVLKNQDECYRQGTYITCVGIDNLTEEDKRFESRLADKLCPHCVIRLASRSNYK